MRNARARQNPMRPANRLPSQRSVGPQLNPPMKKTILFSTLLCGLVLSGCNKSTKTDTASTTTLPPASDTALATSSTSTDSLANRTSAAAHEAGNDISRAANNAANSLERAGDRAANAMSNMAHDASARITEWRLSSQDIQADLAADRDIVRTRTAAVGAPTGKIDKDTLQSAVEGRIKADSDLSNLKLSDARANAVMAKLAENGVDAGMLTAKGYGDTKPVADNATDEGRAKNRRIEYTVVQ